MPSHRSSKQNRFIRKKKKTKNPGFGPSSQAKQSMQQGEQLRLNKYIAHSGFCSRREADTLIAQGDVLVNGEVVTEMGHQVSSTDQVVVSGQHLRLERFTYILLHKPKNTITTTSDEKDRKTVMHLVENATGLRVYPVGRLDRNTTGALLMTNDGDLAHRLMHPSYEVSKTYELESHKKFNLEDLKKLVDGIELEDGLAKAYRVAPSETDPRTIYLSIHEGRNRQVRRMAEALGHEVVKLKRIDYAGLNLKMLKPGRWRFLKDKEINALRRLVKLKPLDFGQKPVK